MYTFTINIYIDVSRNRYTKTTENTVFENISLDEDIKIYSTGRNLQRGMYCVFRSDIINQSRRQTNSSML